MLRVLFSCLISVLYSLILAQPQRMIQDADLASGSYTWFQDTVYILDGYVYLEAGGVLTIAAGTTIKALRSPTSPDPTSALIIANGAKIFADGSNMHPIIFTAETDNVNDPNDLGQTDRGLWGGVVLLGDASVTNNQGAAITTTHPYFSINDMRGQYGGNNANQNSGVINNVSIRFAGASVFEQQFAGLTLAGIGAQTIVDTVEVFASGGDGFRFEGGFVDTRYLAASFCADDAFAWDLGYTGRGQYWFSIQSKDVADCGIEGRGNFSKPIIYNITLLGSGQNSQADNPVAIRFQDGSGGVLGMSIFGDFPNAGIEVEDLAGENDSYAKIENGDLAIIASVWTNFDGNNSFSTGGIIKGSSTGDPNAEVLVNHLVDSNMIKIDYLPYISRTQDTRLNPDYIHYGNILEEFDYLSYPQDSFFKIGEGICLDGGAFITDGAWWLRYWTALDQDQYLMHPCVPMIYEDFSQWGGDTLRLTCEEFESLNFEKPYRCINSLCSLLHQTLSISMRMKRKKKRLSIQPLEYCYIQPISIEGIETKIIRDEYGGIDLMVLDTFIAPLVVLVTDTTKPEIRLIPCDTCTGRSFIAVIEDCDTAWITRSDSLIIDDTLIQYSWHGIDACSNFTDFSIQKNLNAGLSTWYQDLDGDGYGNDSIWFTFLGMIPGYSLIPGDCDDLNPLKNPGLEEDPLDNFDNNCDGRGDHEVCQGSELLPVFEDCNPIQFNWNPSRLEQNSGLASCLSRLSEDGDLWFTLTAPTSGEVTIEYDSEIPIYDMNLYRGSCDNPLLLDCGLYEDTDVHAADLIPGEPLYLQLAAWYDDQGEFTLCATTPGSMSNDTYQLGIQNFKLYPNPTTHWQTVEWELTFRCRGSMYIYNTLGASERVVFHDRILQPGLQKTTLNLSELSTGFYWIVLKTDKGYYTTKTVKF